MIAGPCATCGAESSPCSCVACPTCDGTAARGELGHVCACCGWRTDRCEACGELMTFAPDYRGTTCGGLALVGARACVPCGTFEVCHRSRPATDFDWRIAKSGRSVDAGPVRVRAERGDPGQVESIMARIARLPDLELEIELLRLLVAKRDRAVAGTAEDPRARD